MFARAALGILALVTIGVAVLLGVEVGNAISRALRGTDDDCTTWNDAKTTTRIVHTSGLAFNLDVSVPEPVPGSDTITTKERPTGCGDAPWLARTRARRVRIDGVLLSGQAAICVQHAVDLRDGVWGGECARHRRDHL